MALHFYDVRLVYPFESSSVFADKQPAEQPALDGRTAYIAIVISSRHVVTDALESVGLSLRTAA